MDQSQLINGRQQTTMEYDPFFNPPNLKLAQIHRQSTLVGIFSSKNNPQFCPCCENIVNKEKLSVCFKDEDLLSMGVGYSLYYKIAKYFIAIIVGIFFISGSAIYFLMTLKCQIHSTCYTLFGFPIINISIAEETNLNKTEGVNMLTSIGIFVILVYLKAVINDDIRTLTNKKICPSLYTIMLQNVPQVDNETLIKWITQRFGEAPTLINWAYNVDELKNAYREKQQYAIQYNTIKIRLKKYQQRQLKNPNSFLNEIKKEQKGQIQLKNKMKSLQIRIADCDKILESQTKTDKQCLKNGTVFATFQKVSTVNHIIEVYECSLLNSIFKNMFSFIRKSRLQLNGHIIVVNKAPAPKQVIWDNLHFSYIRSLVFEIFFILCMIMMLVMALNVIIFFMNYALLYKIQGQNSGELVLIIKSICMSSIVLVINCLMRLVIQIFTFAKKYYSFTKYQASFCLYYTIFYVINSCCLVYIVHGNTVDDTNALLFADIHLVMIANAFSEPLFKLIDPVMWYKYFRRVYISGLKPEENPYTQEYINKLWEGHEISNADNYQYITRVLFVTTWFASVAPVGVLISLIGIILDYWISKVLLVKIYKIPENVSEDIVLPTLMGLELLPLVYICGVLQFTYKVSTSPDIFMFFYDFLHYGITTIVIFLSIFGYLLFCKRPLQPQVKRTYSQSKLGFGFNYETENPITRLKGNINYLYDVLKQKNQNSQSSKLITDMISSGKSYDKFNKMRGQLARIKISFHNKLSQQEKAQQLQQLQEIQEIPSAIK